MSKFSDLKVWPLKKNHPTVKANGSFVYDGAFRVKFTLFSGKEGLYVGYPGETSEKLDKDGKKPFYPHVTCLKDEVRKELQEVVVKEYNKAMGVKVMDQGRAPGPTNQTEDDGLPF